MDIDLNLLALKAKTDPAAREKLIAHEKPTILKLASKTCKKYVTESDDEWSVALYAFSRAIDTFEASNAKFTTFAAVVIDHALIDYLRHENKIVIREISTDPEVFEDKGEPEESVEVREKILKKSQETLGSGISFEIAEVTRLLSLYGFSFYDLTKCSPKLKKPKSQCAKAVNYILKRPDVIRKVRENGKIPISEIAIATGIPSKTLDRYRRYILAVALILDGDYPELSEYLKFVRKEEAL